MKQTIIPTGYRISVTTWENDGDNYRTKILEGVKKEHIPFIVAVCNLMGRNANFGNMYEPDDSELEAFKEAITKVIQQHPDRPKDCNNYEAVSDGLLYDLGLQGSEDFFTRVFSRIKIEYVPQQIILEDVTDQFT